MELSHRIVDFFEMADLEFSDGLNIRGLGCVDAIVHTPIESLVLCQGGGCLASIADLPSVPTSSLLLILIKVVLCEIHDFIHVNFHGGTLAHLELFEICRPDFHRLVVLKRWVVELSVDPRHESLVQNANAVGGQKQDTCVKLKNTQEHWRQSQQDLLS
jgi:hypothetical protein